MKQPIIVFLSMSEVQHLHRIARRYNCKTIVSYLINIIINSPDKDILAIHTDLMVKASKFNANEIVEFFIEEKNITPNFVDRETGCSILSWATRNNNESLVYYLLDNYKMDLDHQDNLGFTALHWACENQNFSMVEQITCKGANVDVINSDGYTPIYLVLSSENRNSIDIVKCLLDKDANTFVMEDNSLIYKDLAEFAFVRDCHFIEKIITKYRDSICKLRYTYKDLDDYQ